MVHVGSALLQLCVCVMICLFGNGYAFAPPVGGCPAQPVEWSTQGDQWNFFNYSQGYFKSNYFDSVNGESKVWGSIHESAISGSCFIVQNFANNKTAYTNLLYLAQADAAWKTAMSTIPYNLYMWTNGCASASCCECQIYVPKLYFNPCPIVQFTNFGTETFGSPIGQDDNGVQSCLYPVTLEAPLSESISFNYVTNTPLAYSFSSASGAIAINQTYFGFEASNLTNPESIFEIPSFCTSTCL